MKIAIVTGASSGMGKEFVKRIDKKCHGLDEIWLLARRKDAMEELRQHTKINLRIFPIDLTDKLMMQQFEECLAIEKPDVKILVNCSGYGKTGPFEDISKEETLGMIDVNCYALTSMTYSVIPYMTKHSYIINVASIAGFLPQPNFAVYAATKAYVVSFSRGLREELKGRKIWVSTVCPGPVDTEFFDIAEQTGETFALKKTFLAKKEKVVKHALGEAFAKKDVIVYSLPMKAMHVLVKIVPQRIILNIYAKMLRGVK